MDPRHVRTVWYGTMHILIGIGVGTHGVLIAVWCADPRSSWTTLTKFEFEFESALQYPFARSTYARVSASTVLGLRT